MLFPKEDYFSKSCHSLVLFCLVCTLYSVEISWLSSVHFRMSVVAVFLQLIFFFDNCVGEMLWA